MFNRPTKRQSTKWNRIQRQYAAEMDQLQEQLFPENYQLPELLYWDNSSLWDNIEMFGIVLDDDLGYLESLKGFWVDQKTGDRRATWWLDTGDFEEVSIFNPPTEDAAWDARPA